MAKVIFENLTMEQALTLAAWYDGQGEQDAGVWFDIHEVPVPYNDKIIRDTDDETVTVYCK